MPGRHRKPRVARSKPERKDENEERFEAAPRSAADIDFFEQDEPTILERTRWNAFRPKKKG